MEHFLPLVLDREFLTPAAEEAVAVEEAVAAGGHLREAGGHPEKYLDYHLQKDHLEHHHPEEDHPEEDHPEEDHPEEDHPEHHQSLRSFRHYLLCREIRATIPARHSAVGQEVEIKVLSETDSNAISLYISTFTAPASLKSKAAMYSMMLNIRCSTSDVQHLMYCRRHMSKAQEAYMSVGPNPDVNGNVTVSAPCGSCAGPDSHGDPSRDQDYGAPVRPPEEQSGSAISGDPEATG